jgi:hypothetical protein
MKAKEIEVLLWEAFMRGSKRAGDNWMADKAQAKVDELKQEIEGETND